MKVLTIVLNGIKYVCSVLGKLKYFETVGGYK